MPNDRQLGSSVARDTRHRVPFLDGSGINTAEAKEVEDERIDCLVRQSVLLFKQCLDKKVGSAAALAILGRLLGRDVAQALNGSRRV